MIIRSQDKTKIVNFENLRTIKIEDLEFAEKGEKIITGYGSASFLSLGEYSTEEKAIKVLDMIQEHYAKMRSADCTMVGAIKNVVSLNWQNAECMFEHHKSMYVFEMPADNEVEV